jgi:MoxR-like ATPase
MNERAGSQATKGETAARWLDAEIERLWLLAELRLRELQQAELRPAANHASMAEIEGVLTARRIVRWGSSEPIGGDALARIEAECTAVVEDLRQHAPIGFLAKNLGLRPLELQTLIVAMAPHIDAPLADLFALLRGSSSRRGPDLALVAQLYRLGRSERVALLDVVDPERPLLFWRLLQIMPPDSADGYGSVTYRAIQPTFDLLSVLCGRDELSPALQRTARLLRARPALDDLVLDEPMMLRFSQLRAEVQAAEAEGAVGRMPWLVLWGPRGIGKTEAATRLAALMDRPLLAFNPQPVEAALDEPLCRAQQEALIRRAVLYIGPIAGRLMADALQEISQRVARYPSLVVFGIESLQPPLIKMEHQLQEVELKVPSEPSRLRLWQRAIPEIRRHPDIDLDGLARSFHLTPGEILDTAREALAIAKLGDTEMITHGELRTGIDRRLRNELGELARRITPNATWNDLVLSEEANDRVAEFISRGLYADRVYNEWGFAKRLGYGKGMIALLSGPPGTGKTMLACLIANALGLDLYQIDLSQVVSRWVGETEKQLARTFDQATRAHAVLLFDEADALFSRRTDVKTSNDRYGNLSVNYLLQRVEQYEGVVILTTNKEAALDEALRRRLSLHLHLEVPEVTQREQLWRSLLPPEAPLEPNIDFHALARDYELAGGHIKNAALRAAFLAACEASVINIGLLRRAAGMEMEDMGRLGPGTTLGGLADDAGDAASAERRTTLLDD